jgi:putative ABC transport system permease protein
MFLLLKPGTDVEALQQKFYDNIFLFRAKRCARCRYKSVKYLELYGPTGSLFTPIDEIKLHKASWFGNGDFKTMMILFTLSVLIVVLSAINFINLKLLRLLNELKKLA